MSTTLPSLFRFKAWSNEELFAVCKQIDGSKFPDQRHTAIRILNHVYVVDRIFAANLQGKAHGYSATNTKETPTLEALHEAVQTGDHWFNHYVGALTSEELGETLAFRFTDGGNAHMSRDEMLMHVITHGAYHRGAVGRILTEVGLTAPRDLYTRYLHETEPARRA